MFSKFFREDAMEFWNKIQLKHERIHRAEQLLAPLLLCFRFAAEHSRSSAR